MAGRLGPVKTTSTTNQLLSTPYNISSPYSNIKTNVQNAPAKTGGRLGSKKESVVTKQTGRLGPAIPQPSQATTTPPVVNEPNILDKIGGFISNAGGKINKVRDFIGSAGQKLISDEDKRAARESKNGVAITNNGIVNYNKKNDTYSILDPTGAVGSMRNVVKEGLDAVGKQLLKNIVKTDLKETAFNAEKYVGEMVKKTMQVKSQTVGLVHGTKNFLQEAKRKLVDSNAPIEDILRATLKKEKITLRPTEDITNQIDRVLRTPTLSGQFAKDNGLVDVIRNVDNINNLDQYLIAKQAATVEANGIKTGRDLTRDNLLIEQFAPRYEEMAQKVVQYSNDLLDYSVNRGLISKELATKLKEIYPDYVPLNRVFSELDKSGNNFGTQAVASLSKQTIVQRLVGSERQIESPLESLLVKTNDAFSQGEKNLAAKMLAGYEKLPGNPFQLRELQRGESAAHTISFLDNGVKRIFETTKEVSEAAKNLNAQQLGIIERIFAIPVRVARVGITGINLPFIAANVAKDQVTGFINSNNALRTSILNPINFGKSLFQAIGHGDLYEEMVRAGGGGTSFDIARNQVTLTIKSIRANKNIKSKVAYTITHPSQILRAIENVVSRSEELTRIQQYAGTKQALLKKGMSEADAIAGAAKAARENTVNFARKGEWGSAMNAAVLYLNAGIQGTRTLLRNLKTKPIQTSAKIVTTVFYPVAATTAWNLSSPERRAAYADISDFEKENNIIILPINPTKDADGKWDAYKIPISQEVNNLANLVRKPIEQMAGLDSLKMADVASAILGTVTPINPVNNNVQQTLLNTLTPQAIKPMAENFFNKNFYTGNPIVSKNLEILSPKNQYQDYTSGTMKKLGELTNTSPLKNEQLIKSTFGGLSQQVLHYTDRALAGLDIIKPEEIKGKSLTESIIARFQGAYGGVGDEKFNERAIKAVTEQNDKNFIIGQEAELIYEELKKIPKEEAAKKFDELFEKNPTLAQKVADTAEQDKLGLGGGDRLMMRMQVKNGERARFIYETLKEFKTKEEKAKYYGELIDKKIITEEVGNQIMYLLNGGK